MTKDTKTRMSNKKSNKRIEKARNKKNNISSDDNSTNNDLSDDDSSFCPDDDDNKLNVQEYRKLLKNMFPSKHISKKVKAGERLKKVLCDEEVEHNYDDDDDDDDYDDEMDKKLGRYVSCR